MGDYRGAAPSNLQEIPHILTQSQGPIAFISGGTDLIIELRKGLKLPDLVVDISQVPELKVIEEEDQRIKIGAAVSFSAISSHPLLCKKAAGLAEAAAQVGSVQIRNRATLGGNIAGYAAAADSIPPLLTLDACLTLLNRRGVREISLCDYLSERRQGKFDPGELITAIGFPLPHQDVKSAFVKVGVRSSVTKAKLSLAALIQVDPEDEEILSARLAVGALGTSAFRLEDGEKLLKNRPVTPELLEEFSTLMVRMVDAAIEGRPSLPYKRVAVRGMAQDLFKALWPHKFAGWGDLP
jgi:CO/xanthine dehydrogenase FAD-binding subunit